MLKGVKIQENFRDFLEEHPELVLLDEKTNDPKIKFPKNAEQVSFTNFLGNISIFYIYNGEAVSFTGKL